jgi:hypothetical protein
MASALLSLSLLVLSAPMANTSTRPANPSITNTPSWIVGVLNGIGAPLTSNNVRSLELWAGSENTAAKWNPLATTEPASGATSFNSVGVRNYPNEAIGVQATVQTLQQSNMTQIRNSLVNNAPVSDTTAAINSSPWGSHIGPNTTPIGQQSPGGSSGSGTSSSSQDCGSSTGIKVPLGITSVTILNGCQLKALKGGVFVLAGGAILLVSVILIVGKSVPKPLAALGGFIGGRETSRVPASAATEGRQIPATSQDGASTMTRQEREFASARARGAANAQEAGPFPEE